MSQKRLRTKYTGVFYRSRKRIGEKGTEKVYFVTYKRDGKTVECKAGRQYADQMTPAKASLFRANLIEGREETPQAKREKAKQKEWNFDNLWNDYEEHKDSTTKALKVDKIRYDKHLKKAIGHKKPEDLAPLDIERLKRVQCKDLSPQTVKHVIALIVRLARHGQKMGHCQGLTFIPTLPKVSNNKTEDLTPEQVERLTEVLNSWPDQTTAGIFKLAMVTGMRRGELFRLKWSDVDFNRNIIFIRVNKRDEPAEIPLNEAAKDILVHLPEPEMETEYIFPGKFGQQRTCVKRAASNIRAKAGLSASFRMLHGLRHYYASELASSGKVDMYTLQKLLTHKEPRMTQRYAHLRDKQLHDASALMNDIFKGKLAVVK